MEIKEELSIKNKMYLSKSKFVKVQFFRSDLKDLFVWQVIPKARVSNGKSPITIGLMPI